jgi:hypothetical protein
MRYILVSRQPTKRIEVWWGTLRKCATGWYINLFKDLRDVNLNNDGNMLYTECLKYCFMPVIQSALDTFMMQWNCHNIQKRRNSELPAGKPDLMYFAPQMFGSHSYKLGIVKEDTERCRHLFGISTD